MATSDLSETVEGLVTEAASNSSQQASTSSQPSLLSKLGAPTQSDLMRKRTVNTKEQPQPPCEKRSSLVHSLLYMYHCYGNYMYKLHGN